MLTNKFKTFTLTQYNMTQKLDNKYFKITHFLCLNIYIERFAWTGEVTKLTLNLKSKRERFKTKFKQEIKPGAGDASYHQ